MLPLLFLLQVCVWLPLTYALTNVSVSQADSLISYTGEWDIQTDPMDVGGTHLLAEYDPQATAIFTFTGVAVYFESPQWPYHVVTDVSLDNGPVVTLNLQDFTHDPTDGGFASIPSAPIPGGIWTGLDNGQHSLRITVPPGENWAVVDNIIYTQLDSSDPGFGSGSGGSSSSAAAGAGKGGSSTTITGASGSHTSSGSSSESTQSIVPVGASSSSRKSKRLAIALGIVCTLIGLALLLCLFLLIRRRRRLRQAQTPIPAHSGPEAVLGGGGTSYPYRGPDAQPRNPRDPFADPSSGHPEPAFVAGGLVSQADHDSSNGSSGGPERGYRQHDPALVPRKAGSDPDAV